jgi:hypothetical protein
MEAGGGSRWRDENGPSDEIGRKPRRLQYKLFLFKILNRILDSKIKGLKYF